MFPGRLYRERGVVLIVVLLIAFAFAILGFTVLRSSINSLEASEQFEYTYQADLTAEGGINRAALAVRDREEPHGGYLDPAFALSSTEDDLRVALLEAGFTQDVQLNSFPITFESTAYTFDTQVSTYSPDTNVIPGDRDNSEIRYLDDQTFTEDYPAYEYAPVQSTGNLRIYGVGEVQDINSDMSALSFLQGKFPTVQWNFDVREDGVREPSRLGPYPYIETQHPYQQDKSKAWVVSYLNDPNHPNRDITGIRLMANPNEVEITAGDLLHLAPWDEAAGRFDPPAQTLGPYFNGPATVFSNNFGSKTIGLLLQSDINGPNGFGFRVSGVRYDFTSDFFEGYYETPHPYDKLVQPADPVNWNIQTVYAPYQDQPGFAPGLQQMRIRFDENFSLDPLDHLYLFNTTISNPLLPVEDYWAGNPLPADGWSPIISRNNLIIDPARDQPLGFIIILGRPLGAGDTDGNPDYGYKVVEMEYTDEYNQWIGEDDVVMETSHHVFNGRTDEPIIMPIGLLGVPPNLTFLPEPLAGYQTIYRPAVPDTDNISGQGTISRWWAVFEEGSDLFVDPATGPANDDFISLYTPGNFLVPGFNLIYFVNELSSNGGLIGNGQYFNVLDLSGFVANCGTAPYLQIHYFADPDDWHAPEPENWGFTVAEVGYETPDGSDDDTSRPTIRSEANYPANTSYPSYGPLPVQNAEWWYSNPNAIAIGMHFDRVAFDMDPGDRIEIYDEMGILRATVLSTSVRSRPEAGGPQNPDDPNPGTENPGGPGAGGPFIPDSLVARTVVDLDQTYGWVVIKGTTARLKLIGDGDDNEGYAGFEVNYCGYVNGDITEIQNYVTEFEQLQHGELYDRFSEPMSGFGPIGTE